MALVTDKVVLVSGGTQGVGAGVVRAAEKLVTELSATGTEAHFVKTDLADPHQAAQSVNETVRLLGRIDCLVNSAGLTTRGTLLDTSVELFDQHIAINCARHSSPCKLPCPT